MDSTSCSYTNGVVMVTTMTDSEYEVLLRRLKSSEEHLRVAKVQINSLTKMLDVANKDKELYAERNQIYYQFVTENDMWNAYTAFRVARRMEKSNVL